MTKLNVQHSGFKLGVQIADDVALAYAGSPLQIDVLHALKNIAHNEGLFRQLKLFGINGGTYAI